jgi:hypothetical protein
MSQFRVIGFFYASGTRIGGPEPPEGPSWPRRLTATVAIAIGSYFAGSAAAIQVRIAGSVTAIERVGQTMHAAPDPTVKHRPVPAAPTRSGGCLGERALT